jgi:hypothetical protein
MHYHLEIVMPDPGHDDIEGTIDKILEPFSEYNDDSRHTFWDWYVIGGRWHGCKVEAQVPKDVLDAFYQWCNDEKITVSSVQCGKQDLSPIDQIPKVDAKWQEMTGLDGPCLIFGHGDIGNEADICTVGELPKDLKASHVIIANDANRAQLMWQDDMWNGVSWQRAGWDGTVSEVIEHYIKERNADQPIDDWLVVTVDYHN